MMKVKAIIVDDENQVREALGKLLCKYCPEVDVVVEADSVASAVENITLHQPQWLFLDIELQDGSGFDILDQLQDKNDLKVIFVTSHDEFALTAFRYSAVDYLLKPVDPLELVEAVNKLKEREKEMFDSRYEVLNDAMKEQKTADRLVIHSRDHVDVVEVTSIVRIQSDNNYCDVFMLDDRKITVCKPLKDYEQLLADAGFVRIHQSHLVNTRYIHKILPKDNHVQFTDGTRVNMSRKGKEVLMDYLK